MKPGYENASGLIQGNLILVNEEYYAIKGDNGGRVNFTIAQELGHYLLNHVPEDQCLVTRRHPLGSKSISEDEQEADWFAAKLLMPDAFLTRILKEYQKVITVKNLEIMFAVPRDVVGFCVAHLTNCKLSHGIFKSI
jgi:Zn-dependent peptidase ImmA (M78 family)